MLQTRMKVDDRELDFYQQADNQQTAVWHGRILLLLLLSLGWWSPVGEALAADWPLQRGDAGRTGYTAESLAGPLQPMWVYRASHPPQTAWPRSDRQTFDRAIHPVIVGQTAFWGDTVTGTVIAADVNSGEIRWRFHTEGPIRFAPAAFEEWLFVTSDDGFLYAVRQTDGSLAWKHRGGPDHNRRLGNERMISRWPARGGAVVQDGIVYYAAGIWPSDGVFLYALDARTGEPVWTNDKSGGIYMPQPHGGADAESGVAAQGYLVANNAPLPESTPVDQQDSEVPSRLLVPTGRAVPAVFDRKTGEFRYFHLQKYGHKGGAEVQANDRFFFNSGIMFDLQSGEGINTLGAGPLVLTPDGLVKLVEGKLAGFQWELVEKQDRKGASYQAPSLKARWAVGDVPIPRELIMVGKTVILGADGEVVAVDSEAQKILWRHPVDGAAPSLAFANGRLLVGTDTGAIYAFGPASSAGNATPSSPREIASVSPEQSTPVDPHYTKIAERILQTADQRAGYLLDLGCGDGQLAEALAKESEFQIIAVDDDPAAVAQARNRLEQSQLLGARVTVLHVSDLSDTGLPNYFANLVVSQRALTQGASSLPLAERERLQRPYGGVAVLGRPDELEPQTRGPLAGAGQWTHQYATAGNTTCSTDELVKGPLGLLWFRDVDLEMPQRHGRGPGPLFFDGRLYSLGLHELACVDAYNGRLLWKYSLPDILKAYDGDELMGTAGTHSNYCVAESGVYVRKEGHCLRIDRVTGELIQRFNAPLTTNNETGTWGFIACEQGVLLGSLANPEHVVTFRYRATSGDMKSLLTESQTLFALDAETGKLLWRYDAKDSIRHNAIAFDGASVYLIDRPLALADREKNAKVEEHPLGVLIALDAKTGRERWRNAENIDGTLLALSDQHPVLVMGGQPTRFALESEQSGSLATFDVESGEERWRKQAQYASRPMINDRTIYSQGGAWDLLSGYPLPFDFKRSYGCGVLAGSRNTMVFRSATLGYFDFERQGKVENFGGVRPGCWINAIPAGGLVLVPDASAGCVCSYLNQSWFALEPDGSHPPRLSPPGGAFREQLELTMTPDEAGQTIHYTTDGSSPDQSSPVYRQPLPIRENLVIKARAYDAQGRAGRVAEAEFVIDPRLLPIEDEHWRVWDITDSSRGKISSAPSRWAVQEGVITQTSNIYQGSATDADPLTERYGTLRLYQAGQSYADGVLSLEIRSDDDDGIGVVFRAENEQRHYLFNTDKQRNFSILAVKDGDTYRVLATADRAYQVGKWHRYRIHQQGEKLRVEMDGETLLEAEDATFSSGTIGLHCWGSDKVQFRDILWEPAK